MLAAVLAVVLDVLEDVVVFLVEELVVVTFFVEEVVVVTFVEVEVVFDAVVFDVVVFDVVVLDDVLAETTVPSAEHGKSKSAVEAILVQ